MNVLRLWQEVAFKERDIECIKPPVMRINTTEYK